MIKVIVTKAVVSKGVNGNPAVYFNEKGNFARFRVGTAERDNEAENNTRWTNFTVKAFGEKMYERIRKLKLKEGSMLSLVGRYSEETWEDKKTKEKRFSAVIELDDIEFWGGGGKKPENEQNGQDDNSGSYNGNGSSYHSGFNPYPNDPNGYADAPNGNPNPNNQGYGAQNPSPADEGMPGNFSGFAAFSGGSEFF